MFNSTTCLARASTRLATRPHLLPSRPLLIASRLASSSSSASASTSTPLPSSHSTSDIKLKFPDPPQARYKRQAPIDRDLPTITSRTPLYLAVAICATLSWAGFLSYATNNERANSSVVRSLAFQLRSSPVVEDFLGENVKLPTLFGEFRRVKGSINMLSGKIDVQFRVKGAQSAGTAAFTSVRRGKEGKFEVLRWRITRDDGEVLDLRTDPRLIRGDGAAEPESSVHVV